MRSIQESSQKIKHLAVKAVGEYGVGVIIVLVAFTCFGLGRLSVLTSHAPISISQAGAAAEALSIGGSYVAAKGGTSYYFPWCSGAEAIAPGEQLWFRTEEAAQKAGYVAAKNCKGLTE